MVRNASVLAVSVCWSICVTRPAALAAQDTGAHHPVAVNPHIVAALQAPKVFSREQITRLLGPSARRLVIRRAGSTQSAPAPVTSVALRPGDVMVARLADTATRTTSSPAGSAPAWKLPFRLLTLGPTGDTSVLSIWVPQTALLYDGMSGTFAQWVKFYLVDSLHPGAAGVLATPVQVVATARHATVAPGSLQIPRMNLPPESLKVSLVGAADTVQLQLATSLDPTSFVDVPLPVERPGAIALEASPRAIRGFGLEEATIHVTLPGEVGSVPQPVRLSARLSTPIPDTLTLKPGVTGSVKIRSTGVGTDTVSATAGAAIASGQVAVHYSAPILFFVAALLGGLAGSEISGYQARKRGKTTKRLRYVVGGLTTGVFVAVAFAIGLNFTSVDILVRSGEAVVFVVAGLGALIGLPGLAKAIPALDRVLHPAKTTP